MPHVAFCRAYTQEMSDGFGVVSSVFTIPYVSHQTKGRPVTETVVRPFAPLADFVAGPENALLKTAAETIRSTPRRYNPLVVTGPSGVGKTHLLHALASCYKAANPTARIVQLNGTDFLRSLANAIELDAVAELRAKHRRAHLFLLDDLHQLASRPQAQQELLQTTDVLLSRCRMLVVASRPALSDLCSLLPALTSRLSVGLCIPMVFPELATRGAILRRLAEIYRLKLTEDAIYALLARPPDASPALHTVSQLHDAIRQLRVYANRDQDINRNTVVRFLDQHKCRSPLCARSITKCVARYFRVKVSDLTGPSRRQAIVVARGVAIYLGRKLTGVSFEQLGHQLGRRDHTTVLHAYRRIESCLERDAVLQIAVAEVSQQLDAATRST